MNVIGRPLPVVWEQEGVEYKKQPDEMTENEWEVAIRNNVNNIARIPDQSDPFFVSLIDEGLNNDPLILYSVKNPSAEQVERAVRLQIENNGKSLLTKYIELCLNNEQFAFNYDLFKKGIVGLKNVDSHNHPPVFNEAFTKILSADIEKSSIDAIPYWEEIFSHLKTDMFYYSSMSKLSRQESLFSHDIGPFWSEQARYDMIRLEPYSDMVQKVGGLNQFSDEFLIKIIDEFPNMAYKLKSPSYPVMAAAIDALAEEYEAVKMYNNFANLNMRKDFPSHPVNIGIVSVSPFLSDENYGVAGLGEVLKRLANYPDIMSVKNYRTHIRPVLEDLPFGKAALDDWRTVSKTGQMALDYLPDIEEGLKALMNSTSGALIDYIEPDLERISAKIKKQIEITADQIHEEVPASDLSKPYDFDDRYTL